MSIYPPPTDFLPIFNTSDYITTTSTPNYATLDGILTNFPISQRSGAGNATIPNGSVLSNLVTPTIITNTLVGSTPSTNVNLFPNSTDGVNNFNIAGANTFGTRFGNKTSTDSIIDLGCFQVTSDISGGAYIDVADPTTDFNIGNLSVSGLINFGTSSRSGGINIGTGDAAKTIQIGRTGLGNITFGSGALLTANKIYIGGRSRYAWSQTFSGFDSTFDIATNFPTEGIVFFTSVGNLITFSEGTPTTNNRLFTLQIYGNLNAFKLTAGYTFKGLLAGYTGTETAAADILNLDIYNTYYFLIDEINKFCVLISATNFLSNALTYPATLAASYSTAGRRGNQVLNFSALSVLRTAAGAVNVSQTQLIPIARLGIYYFTIVMRCYLNNSSGRLNIIGMGARTAGASTPTFTNYLEGMSTYTDSYDISMNGFLYQQYTLTGFYVYTNSNTNTVVLDSIAGATNAGGSTFTVNTYMTAYFVG